MLDKKKQFMQGIELKKFLQALGERKKIVQLHVIESENENT